MSLIWWSPLVVASSLSLTGLLPCCSVPNIALTNLGLIQTLQTPQHDHLDQCLQTGGGQVGQGGSLPCGCPRCLLFSGGHWLRPLPVFDRDVALLQRPKHVLHCIDALLDSDSATFLCYALH